MPSRAEHERHRRELREMRGALTAILSTYLPVETFDLDGLNKLNEALQHLRTFAAAWFTVTGVPVR